MAINSARRTVSSDIMNLIDQRPMDPFSTGLNMINQGIALQDHFNQKRITQGIPPTEDQISTQQPLFAAARGYKPELLPVEPTSEVDTNQMLAGPQQQIWVKPGRPGTVGTNELELRQRMLPYVKFDPEDPEGTDQNIKSFLSEPDRGKALKYIQFTPKNSKAPVVIDAGKLALLEGTPLGGVLEEGMSFSRDEWKEMEDLAKYSFQVNREGRLKDTVNLQNQLKKVGLAIQKQKLAKAEQDANLDKMVGDMMSGFGAGKPTPEASGTKTTTPTTKPKPVPSNVFSSEKEVEDALKSGKIKYGDEVTVGKQKFKVQK